MAFQPVPITAEVRVRYQQTGNEHPYINLVYFTRPGGYSQAQIQTLADEVAVRYGTSLLPAELATSIQVVEIRARDLSTEFGVQAFGAAVPIAGTDLALQAPPSCALMVRFISSTPPPRKGGIFFPSVREMDVNNLGEVSAAQRTVIEDKVHSWVDGVELAAGVEHVIVSRFANKVARPSGVSSPVTDYQCLRRVASQRDRRAVLSGF